MLRPHFLRVKTLRNRPKISHEVLWCCLVNPGTMEWRRPYTVGWWLKGWWLRWHQVADISIWGWFIKPFPLVHVTIVRHFCLWWDWYMSLCIELIIKNQPKNVGKKNIPYIGSIWELVSALWDFSFHQMSPALELWTVQSPWTPLSCVFFSRGVHPPHGEEPADLGNKTWAKQVIEGQLGGDWAKHMIIKMDIFPK